jgi:hypothetical protein
MQFGPLMESCVPVKMFQLGGGFDGFLLHQIKSSGVIKYVFIFSVFKDKNPFLYYCAERNVESKNVFIGVFDEVGHKNLGVDNSCEDLMSFLMKSLEYVCENLSLDREGIKEVPLREK